MQLFNFSWQHCPHSTTNKQINQSISPDQCATSLCDERRSVRLTQTKSVKCPSKQPSKKSVLSTSNKSYTNLPSNLRTRPCLQQGCCCQMPPPPTHPITQTASQPRAKKLWHTSSTKHFHQHRTRKQLCHLTLKSTKLNKYNF